MEKHVKTWSTIHKGLFNIQYRYKHQKGYQGGQIHINQSFDAFCQTPFIQYILSMKIKIDIHFLGKDTIDIVGIVIVSTSIEAWTNLNYAQQSSKILQVNWWRIVMKCCSTNFQLVLMMLKKPRININQLLNTRIQVIDNLGFQPKVVNSRRRWLTHKQWWWWWVLQGIKTKEHKLKYDWMILSYELQSRWIF